jgi:hypothetical protein
MNILLVASLITTFIAFRRHKSKWHIFYIIVHVNILRLYIYFISQISGNRSTYSDSSLLLVRHCSLLQLFRDLAIEFRFTLSASTEGSAIYSLYGRIAKWNFSMDSCDSYDFVRYFGDRDVLETRSQSLSCLHANEEDQ